MGLGEGKTTLDDALRARRSIRAYAPLPVPDELIDEVLDLTRHAPSSMGKQPWCFIVIRDAATRGRLAELKNAHCPPEKREDYPADFMCDAPVVVAVCVERDLATGRVRENGVVAAAFLLLAAHARGLGSVYMTAYHPQQPELAAEVADQLQLPPDVEPVALVPLGFAAEPPPEKVLRPLAEHVHHEAFGNRTP